MFEQEKVGLRLNTNYWFLILVHVCFLGYYTNSKKSHLEINVDGNIINFLSKLFIQVWGIRLFASPFNAYLHYHPRAGYCSSILKYVFGLMLKYLKPFIQVGTKAFCVSCSMPIYIITLSYGILFKQFEVCFWFDAGILSVILRHVGLELC
jgi:hypothetical protein